MEDGADPSVEVISSIAGVSRSVRISVKGSFLASPCGFLGESSRHNRVSRHNVGHIGDSSVESIVTEVTTLTMVEVDSSKMAVTQKQKGGSLVDDLDITAFVAGVAAMEMGS